MTPTLSMQDHPADTTLPSPAQPHGSGAGPLAIELAARLARFRASAPAEAVALIDRANDELARSPLLANAKREGDTAPGFTLQDHHGVAVSLDALIARGPLILTFYRGGWCPYCNLELRAYGRELDAIHAAGANLAAISPEKPDRALDTATVNELRFPVLSDPGNTVARDFGIVFTLPEPLQALYGKLGHALPDVNGTDDWSLPVPATFVIGRDRRIVLASVDADYRRRLEPAAAIAAAVAARDAGR